MALSIFSLGKLPEFTENMSCCFLGVTTQSAQWCLGLIYAVLDQIVLKACSLAARIKPSVPFFKITILEPSPGLLSNYI